VLWASEQPRVVASGRWIDEGWGTLGTPQWKYRVPASVSRSRLADIQRKKRATAAGELGLEDNDIHLTVLFETSFE